jgi:cbb3-type cytochrome oxidase subunit 1
MQQPGAVTYEVEPDFAARQSVLWSIVWLLGATTIAFGVQLLFLEPDLTSRFAFLSPGRLRGVAETAFVFGWLGTLGFAAMFALVPRITEVQLHNEALGAATTLTWSVLLTGGTVALLLGRNQGRPLAELGSVADLGMVLMLVAALYNVGVTITRRRERTLYASGWFLVAAALLAPLIFILGNLPVFSGVTDAIVSGFYMNGIEMLWLLPVALGIAHYVVPVESGKALYSSAMARTAFWSLMFAGGWAGQRYYLQGPMPGYLDTIAAAMTLVLLIPALSVAANLFATARDRWQLVSRSYALRFAATGLGLLVAWIAIVAFTTVPSVHRFVGLTAWQAGVRYLALAGVFSAFAFAFIYHIYPLMVGRDWYSRSAASFHFWATQIGVSVGVVALLAIGTAQAGVGPAEASPPVAGLLRIVVAVSFGAVAIAQYVFAYNAVKTSRQGPYVNLAERAALLEAIR